MWGKSEGRERMRKRKGNGGKRKKKGRDGTGGTKPPKYFVTDTGFQTT